MASTGRVRFTIVDTSGEFSLDIEYLMSNLRILCHAESALIHPSMCASPSLFQGPLENTQGPLTLVLPIMLLASSCCGFRLASAPHPNYPRFMILLRRVEPLNPLCEKLQNDDR